MLAPAWTTDWMSEDGRRKLARLRHRATSTSEHRTGARAARPPTRLGLRHAAPVECPQCGSADTEELTRFGSTSCKAMWRCRSCREPFDHFRAH